MFWLAFVCLLTEYVEKLLVDFRVILGIGRLKSRQIVEDI